jgi:hypothetical protein
MVNLQKLKELGAVAVGEYPVRQSTALGMIQKCYSKHYFNNEGLEVAYTIPMMWPYDTLTVFDVPRVWASSFKEELLMSDLVLS